MNNISKTLLFGTLILALIAVGGFAATQSAVPALAQAADTATPASASSGGATVAPSGASGGAAVSTIPPVGGTQTASVVVWDRFCVSKVPYTLLAMPQDAKFEVVQPDIATPTVPAGYVPADKIACETAGVFRDQQIVACRGPQLFSFTLNITGGDAAGQYQVDLKDCPLPATSTPGAPPATPAP